MSITWLLEPTLTALKEDLEVTVIHYGALEACEHSQPPDQVAE